MVLDPIARGIEHAVERVSNDLPGFQPRQIDIELARDLVTRTIEAGARNWHPRAILVLSDLVTIGVCSRSHYGEQQLGIETVIRFSESLEEILNCWFHE